MTKSYQQFCGVAKALDVVGERWTLLVVRNLLVGGMRYKDLLDTLPGITTNLLADRLKALVQAGLLEQRALPPPSNGSLYELTARGRELEPVVLALGRFGAHYLDEPRKGERTHPRYMMVSLMRRYRGVKQPATLGLHVTGPHGDAHHYVLRMGEQRLDVQQGQSEHLDAQLHLTLAAFRALLVQGIPLDTLLASNDLTIEGPRRIVSAWAKSVGANIHDSAS